MPGEPDDSTNSTLPPPGQAHPAPGIAAPAPGGPLLGDFRLISLLGEGGMGAVYLAEDTNLHRQAAVKVMKPELAARPDSRERFLREARAAAKVQHDYIVPIYSVGEDASGAPYFAMPLLRGEPLESLLKREGVPPLEVTLKAGREIAEGLAAAHAAGLIHRDVKPANVWVEHRPANKGGPDRLKRFRLLDFGLARAADDSVRLTSTGAIMGTPAYMAPEQADDASRVDHRADLFSLGVILYRMTTGTMPFRGATVMQVLGALQRVVPPPARSLNPAVPEKLSSLIDELLSKDALRRPASGAVVADALRQLRAVRNRPSDRRRTVPDDRAPQAPVPQNWPPAPVRDSPNPDLLELVRRAAEVVAEFPADLPPPRPIPARKADLAPKRVSRHGEAAFDRLWEHQIPLHLGIFTADEAPPAPPAPPPSNGWGEPNPPPAPRRAWLRAATAVAGSLLTAALLWLYTSQ